MTTFHRTEQPIAEAWVMPPGNLLITTVTEAGETAITLTCTTPGIVADARAALATLATALQAAARERRAVTA